MACGSFSASAITRRTETAEHVEAQMLTRINESIGYKIQFGRSTDADNKETMLALVNMYQEDVRENT